MKRESNNTKEKRLRHSFGITPREARLILKSSSYNYRLAENVLYQNGFKKLNLTTSELCEALKRFAKVVEKFVSAFNTFAEKMKEVAKIETPI